MAEKQSFSQHPRRLKWYEKKRWVILTGLVCGMGIAALIVDEPLDYIPLVTPEPAVAADPTIAEDSAATTTTVESSDESESEETTAGSETSTTSSDSGSGTPAASGPYDLVILGVEDVPASADSADSLDTSDTSDSVNTSDSADSSDTSVTSEAAAGEPVLKIVRAELNEYPIEKRRLRAALELELEKFSGVAHAVSFQILYDRREPNPPAFGIWDWAPEGEWSKASEGNAETWEDYEWSEPSGNKYESPTECTPPRETELELSLALADRRDEEPEESDDEAIEGLAEEVDLSPESIGEMFDGLSDWLEC